MDVPPVTVIEKQEQQGVGPLVAIFIIVILFAVGGVYFLITEGQKLHQPPAGDAPINS